MCARRAAGRHGSRAVADPVKDSARDAAPASDAGAAFVAVLEGADGPEFPSALGGEHDDELPDRELTPLTPSDAAPKRKGGRRRKTEREKKDARNKKLRDKRNADKALAAAEGALGIKPDGNAQGEKRTPGEPAPDAAASAVQSAEIPPEQLATLLGLACDVTARSLPVKWGGGPLTASERELLGSVWATAAAPYLKGEASVIGIALISTVQVFALRAMSAKPEEPEQPTPEQPLKGSASAPAKDGAPAKPSAGQPAKGATVLPATKRRVPSVIND